MQIRRCEVLFIEPREDLGIDWAALFAGSSVLSATMRWIALAPHLDGEREIDATELAVLGAVGQTQWTGRAQLDARFGAEVIERLLAAGLLVGDAPEHAPLRERDETLRGQHWRPLSALAHGFARWEGMKVDSGMQFPTFEQLVENYGAPPPPAVERGDSAHAIALPGAPEGALDAFMLNRYTGRNFDKEAVLPLDVAARLLQRTFGAQLEREMAPGAFVFKKAAPSAGGLHPIEAYVLVQRVEGVPAGLYHYHPVRHTLDPIKALSREQAAQLALTAVADQDWFADAPIMVVLAARVERNFWKYRNHVKAYRAILLDAGHLSQTWYLLASEAGMPGFITAAINEIDLEKALGLDPLKDAVIAVCGCGKSSGLEDTVEMRYQA